MKKIAILLENLFDEHELIYPYHRLKKPMKSFGEQTKIQVCE